MLPITANDRWKISQRRFYPRHLLKTEEDSQRAQHHRVQLTTMQARPSVHTVVLSTRWMHQRDSALYHQRMRRRLLDILVLLGVGIIAGQLVDL